MDKIKVSVLCAAYNHEQYIKDALEGFVNQKTEFKYEVLINDDCSTDNTAKIIREYEKRYPDIIKPIYQTENQYSKGVSITSNILLPLAKGKYIALCEGDDYWTDNNKLQMQYDYMEKNINCYMCVHSYIIHNCKNDKNTEIIRSDFDRDFTIDEIVDGGGGLFSTNSFFMKREVKSTMPNCFYAKGFGDYQMLVYASILGSVHYINKTMSVYNYMTKNSWSTTIAKEKNREMTIESIRMLNNINNYYGGKYNNILENKIDYCKFQILLIDECYRDIIKCKYYINNKNTLPLQQKAIILIGCVSKKLVRVIKKIKRKLIK